MSKGGKDRSRKGEKRRAPGEVPPKTEGGGGPRVPSLLMIPVGLLVGYFAADWLGAVFGGLVGVFLWRSRA